MEARRSAVLSSCVVIVLWVAALLALSGIAHDAHGEPAVVFVSLILEGRLAAIDVATDGVNRMLYTGSAPAEVGVIDALQRAYVADLADGTVSVVDTVGRSVTAVVVLPHPVAAIGADGPGGKVYALDFSNGAPGTDLHVIDTVTNTLSHSFTVGAQTQNIAVSSANHRVYVTDFVHGLIVFDTAVEEVVTTLPLADLPHGIALNESANHILVTHLDSDAVTVLDAGSLAVVDAVTVGDIPQWIAVDPPRSKVFVTNEGGNSVSVIDFVTGGYAVHPAVIPVGPDPLTVTIDSAAAKAYVYNAGDGSVSIIDTVTEIVVSTVVVLFSDGFESGGTSSWSATVP